MKISERIKHGWNAFLNRDPTYNYRDLGGPSYGYRPDRMRFTRGNERSIVTSVYNRIALDAASIDIMHVQLDKDDRFESIRDSDLNECLIDLPHLNSIELGDYAFQQSLSTVISSI